MLHSPPSNFTRASLFQRLSNGIFEITESKQGMFIQNSETKRKCELGLKQFRLAKFLLDSVWIAKTRPEIMDFIHQGILDQPFERSIEGHIESIRMKISLLQLSDKVRIETIRGYGYISKISEISPEYANTKIEIIPGTWFSPDINLLYNNQGQIELRVLESEILLLFLDSPDRVFSPSQVAKNTSFQIEAVTSQISDIRKKLDLLQPGLGSNIITVIQEGYKYSNCL